ncbi:hypothetical protein U1Q18_042195 [Sarracenia purpurea var. burkii]
MWINVFEVEFDFEQWTPQRVSYQVRSNNRWPVTFFCKVYDLATEMYEEITISNKYSQLLELAERERKFRRNPLDRIKEGDEDNVGDDSHEDGNDFTSRRNQRSEDVDVIDEGIEEEDDGEIQPAARNKEMRGHNEEIE